MTWRHAHASHATWRHGANATGATIARAAHDAHAAAKSSSRRFSRMRGLADARACTIAIVNHVADSGYCCIMTRVRSPSVLGVSEGGVSAECPGVSRDGGGSRRLARTRRGDGFGRWPRGVALAPGVLFSGRADGSAPARRSARTIHARPSHAAYARRVCGPSRPTSRTASHAYPRRSTSRKSSRASSERRTRPNSLGELFSTHVRKCSISAGVMGRRAAPVWTRNSARRRSLLRRRSRGGIATPGRKEKGRGCQNPERRRDRLR